MITQNENLNTTELRKLFSGLITYANLKSPPMTFRIKSNSSSEEDVC